MLREVRNQLEVGIVYPVEHTITLQAARNCNVKRLPFSSKLLKQRNLNLVVLNE